MLLKIAVRTAPTPNWQAMNLASTGTVVANAYDYSVAANSGIEIILTGDVFTPAGSSTAFASAHHGVEEAVWESWANQTIASVSTITLRAITEDIGLVVGQQYRFLLAGANPNGRGTTYTINGVGAFYAAVSGGTAQTPNAPVEVIATATDGGDGRAVLNLVLTGSNVQKYLTFFTMESAGAQVVPGQTNSEVLDNADLAIGFSDLTSNPVSLDLVYDNGVDAEMVAAQTSFVLGTVTDGAATATFIGENGNLPYTDDVTYEVADYFYRVTCVDASTFTFGPITLSPELERDFVTAVDPVSDATGILYSWESGGAVTGDQVDWLTEQCTVREDFTFFGPAGETDVTLNINYWDSVSQIRYAVSVIVSFDESGEGTVTGLTSVGFTASGFTVRGFTSRGF